MTTVVERARAIMVPCLYQMSGAQPSSNSIRLATAGVARLLADVAHADGKGRLYPGRGKLAASDVRYEFRCDEVWNTAGVIAHNDHTDVDPADRYRIVLSAGIDSTLIRPAGGHIDRQLLGALFAIAFGDWLSSLNSPPAVDETPMDRADHVRWTLRQASPADEPALANHVSLISGTPFSRPGADVVRPFQNAIQRNPRHIDDIASMPSVANVSIHEDDFQIRIVMTPIHAHLPLSCDDMEPMRALTLARRPPIPDMEPVSCYR